LLTNAELEDVEVVIAPDHMVFHHTNPLKGLVDGGTFIMQSAEEPLAVWESLPGYARDYIVRHQIKFLVIDAFAVAKKHAPTPELQTRMMGIAFIGAILGHVDKVSAQASGDVMALVEHEIEKKFGRKGRKVVDSNMAVIRDGEAAVVTVDYASYPDKAAAVSARSMKASSTTCPMASEPRVSGLFDPAYYEDIAARPFREGAISNSPVFPGAGLFMPVGTGVAKDKGIFRRTVPIFDADKCTACMECALVCPDAAIPNTVHELEDLLDLATRSCDFAQDDGVGVVQDKGIAEDATPDRHLATDFSPTRHLARSEAESLDLHRWAEAMRAELLAGKSPAEACQAGDVPDDWKTLAKAFFTHYPVAVTKPIFVAPEKENPGSGALYAAVVDPWKCTGCLQCVEVCGPGALTATDQDEQVLDDLAARFAWHSELPDTPKRFTEMAIREGGDRKRVLLNRDYYYAMTGGHGACRGCGEVTATRLLLALSHALGDEKRSAHIKELETVLAQLDAYAGAGLAHTETQNPTTQGQSERGLAPSNPGLDPSVPGSAQSVPGLDPERAQTTNYPEEIKEELEHWLYLYEGGPTGRGPSSTVIANATGCSSVYASTMPFQPFTDPWVNSLFQDAQAVSVGLFEGIASALTQEIKALRRAKALVNGEPAPDVDTIGWRDFTKEELSLMPNVLSIGGDGASYDIGFGAMSKVLASGTPVKMLVLDTGAYSNTGGQSSTASYTGQDADLARYGKAHKGKREHRKELGLIAAMHPNVYSCATSTALHSHYLQTVLDMLGYLDGAALMVTYTACGTENGVPEQLANARSELAVRSRMAPVFTHDPRRGESLAERFSLEGNPDERSLWTTSTIEYVDASGSLQLLTTPLTPAEFALGEGRFAKQFKKITDEGADLVPIAEYVELENRAGKTPFVYATDGKRHLIKVACSDAIVALVEDRAHYWRTLQYLAGFPIQELDAEFQAQVEQLKARYDEGLRGREGALDDIAAAMVELVNAKAPKPGPAPVDIDEVAGALVELTTSKTELSGFAYGGRAAEPASTGEEQASEKQAPPIWLDPADEAKCVDCATCYQDLPMFFEKTTIIARGAAQSVAHFKGYDGTAITPALKAKINKVKANCDAGIIQ
ncbi:MAG: 2-oxoacid:acceptor oxidoreductase family protein, partial [Propionibacteriaceae bacterium]|nr:2-oxoacid:acceptor oxidoreductase family protein [Propionibacteriaceae bacterium]